MALSISNESKNNLALTNESKTGTTDTWAMHTETWGQQGGTWGAPGTPLTTESKNTLTITNESKN